MELRRRFRPALWGEEVRVSRHVYVTVIFGVRFFRSIQGFKGDDCGFGALVHREKWTKTSRLSSTRPDRLRCGVGDNSACAARSGGGIVRSVVYRPRCIFYYV